MSENYFTAITCMQVSNPDNLMARMAINDYFNMP